MKINKNKNEIYKTTKFSREIIIFLRKNSRSFLLFFPRLKPFKKNLGIKYLMFEMEHKSGQKLAPEDLNNGRPSKK